MYRKIQIYIVKYKCKSLWWEKHPHKPFISDKLYSVIPYLRVTSEVHDAYIRVGRKNLFFYFKIVIVRKSCELYR